MPKLLKPGEHYAGRRPTAGVLNTTLDAEALALLKHYAPGKQQGAFVARLIYEHHARKGEQQRICEVIVT